MKVDVNKVNEYTREFHVDISWMELKDDFNVSLKKFNRKIKMPGFRPGKVPRERLLQQFQPNIEADFMEDNFQKYYLMAVQQEEIIPVNKAEISDVHFHMNEHFSFKAQFEIEPDNTLPRFKKNMLRVQKTNYIHDEQDIEDAIDQLRKSHARIQTIDDGAREGDFIICTLQKLDESGLPIIGKKYEKQYLKVGDGSFTDEQKERLIGLKTDEKTRLTLPINKEGDHAEYELTVNNVEREILPDLDDDFLRLVNPELSSLDALHDEVEKKIQANFEERSQTAFERDLTDALIDMSNPSFAPSMVNNYLDNFVEDLKKQNNGEPIDEAKVREQYKPLAERNLKWHSLRKLFIEQESISPSKEDVEAEVEKLIIRSPGSEKEIRKYYKKPSNRDRLGDDIAEKKILEYLKQFAKVKEVEVETKDIRGQHHEH